MTASRNAWWEWWKVTKSNNNESSIPPLYPKERTKGKEEKDFQKRGTFLQKQGTFFGEINDISPKMKGFPPKRGESNRNVIDNSRSLSRFFRELSPHCFFNPNRSLDRYSTARYGEDNFLSSFIFLLASCCSFVLAVARYVFELTTNHLLNNLMKSAQDLMTDLGSILRNNRATEQLFRIKSYLCPQIKNYN